MRQPHCLGSDLSCVTSDSHVLDEKMGTAESERRQLDSGASASTSTASLMFVQRTECHPWARAHRKSP